MWYGQLFIISNSLLLVGGGNVFRLTRLEAKLALERGDCLELLVNIPVNGVANVSKRWHGTC
jgi:hypothetical protein